MKLVSAINIASTRFADVLLAILQPTFYELLTARNGSRRCSSLTFRYRLLAQILALMVLTNFRHPAFLQGSLGLELWENRIHKSQQRTKGLVMGYD